MRIPSRTIGLDFETFYDQDYSLRKVKTSMTEYVRDERFKTQCVSIQTSRQKHAKWYHGDAIARILDTIDWDDTAVIAHNANFDGLILSHHYGHVPAYYYCTLSMARPLHGNAIRNDLDTLSRHYGGRGKIQDVLGATKGVRDLPRELLKQLGTYCAQDVEEMWRIFRLMLEEYPQDELDLIHHTINCYANPILQVDVIKARQEHKREIARKKRLFKKVGIEKSILAKREPFAQLLRDAGVEPPKKISTTTHKPTYAFAKADLAFQELEMHPDQRVRDLVRARQAASSNLAETRSARLISHAEPALPLFLKYGGAHTLRWSGGDKNNPQNYPRDGRLRACIVAPAGYVLIVIDSAQIEARVNAWLAGQFDLLDQFRRFDAGDKNADPYKLFAGHDVYRIPVDQVSKVQRFLGKVCILGLGYQMGGPKFQYTVAAGIMGPKMPIELSRAKECVSAYRAKFPAIRDQWANMQNLIPTLWQGGELIEYGPLTFEKGKIWLPNEMYLRYPNLRPWTETVQGDTGEYTRRAWKYNEKDKIYGGLLTENVVQCLARIIVGEQLLRIADKYRLVNIVHDEGIFCVPKRSAEKCLRIAEKEFAIAPDWCRDLPMAGEGIISKEYVKP
jgi:DNA polymerase